MLAKNKVRDRPKIALKSKVELAANQYPDIPLTPMPPPDQTNNTKNKNQRDVIYVDCSKRIQFDHST
jgi:hypothetical protein